jgi:hypothetical protein
MYKEIVYVRNDVDIAGALALIASVYSKMLRIEVVQK